MLSPCCTLVPEQFMAQVLKIQYRLAVSWKADAILNEADLISHETELGEGECTWQAWQLKTVRLSYHSEPASYNIYGHIESTQLAKM